MWSHVQEWECLFRCSVKCLRDEVKSKGPVEEEGDDGTSEEPV